MYVTIDSNKKIYYQEVGTGPTIVLLHGNGEDSSIFTPLAKALSDSFRVIAFDSPGHGRSYQPKSLTYPLMAKDLLKAMHELDLLDPLLLGYSDGGIISLLIALEEQHFLSGMVLCGVNISVDGLEDHALTEMKEKAKEQIRLRGRMSRLLQLMLEQEEIPLDRLKRINTPVLVTAGEFDLIQHAHTSLIAAGLTHANLRIFEGHDHGSYIENSDFLAPHIKAFSDLIDVDRNQYV